MPTPTLVYCLTRDRDLAEAVDGALVRALAFFFNDAARLHQAVMLRAPHVVVVDTGAVRAEFGDAGLGPVFDFLRRRAPDASLAVRPAAGTERLVAAEAGPGVEVLPHEAEACAAVVAAATTGP